MKKETNLISSTTRKLATTVICASLLGLTTIVSAQAQPTIQQGGFSGPSINVSTVKQAKTLKDDSPVVLKGHIIQNIGKEKYIFKDATGTITVEIDQEDWHGVQVSPSDLVEISGEVDKEWNKIEIDVFQVKKIK